MEKLDEISKKYIETKSKSDLKKGGQYFTSNKILLDTLTDDYDFEKKDLKILEPACGVGHVIQKILEKNKNVYIDAIEIDTEIRRIAFNFFKNYGNVKVKHLDFLETSMDKKYDLIIGNPPYYETKLHVVQKEEYREIINGRVNIYSLFIYRCINMLNVGGELRFIIPSTFLSGRYFSLLREYIHKTCEILDITRFNRSNMFHKALQSVIVIKLRRSCDISENFVQTIDNMIYFVKNKQVLQQGYTTVKKLDCYVKTGNIPWNKYKEKLHEEEGQDRVLLVYSHNLKDDAIKLKQHPVKKQYLQITEQNRKFLQHGPFILINRIVRLGDVKLHPVFVKDDQTLFIENHVNVIKGNLKSLEKIYTTLLKQETCVFLNELLGSTQLSQYELENIVPIY